MPMSEHPIFHPSVEDLRRYESDGLRHRDPVFRILQKQLTLLLSVVQDNTAQLAKLSDDNLEGRRLTIANMMLHGGLFTVPSEYVIWVQNTEQSDEGGLPLDVRRCGIAHNLDSYDLSPLDREPSSNFFADTFLVDQFTGRSAFFADGGRLCVEYNPQTIMASVLPAETATSPSV